MSRPISLWALYRAHVIVAVAVCLVQFLLITLLLAQKRRRRLAEAALRESEETARMLLDIPNAVAFLINSEGIFLDANKTLADRMHLPISEIVGRLIWDVFPPEVSAQRRAYFNMALDEKNQIRFEDERDGSVHDTIINPILDEQGRVVKMVVLGFDISDRWQAENALRESKERLHLALEAAKAGIWEWDLSTNGNTWSDEIWKLYGLEPHSRPPSYELWFETIHPDDKENVAKSVYEAARDKTELNVEYKLNRPGSSRWLMSRGKPIYDEHGDKIRYIGTVIDVTERKRIEDTLFFLSQYGWIASGEDFFKALARYLGQNLEMDFVCINRLLDDGISAQTLAIYSNGRFEDNVSYALKDTPCDEVVEKTTCYYTKDVRHLFPNDTALQEMAAESYVGTALWSSEGIPIGLIAVIGRHVLDNPQLAESILKLVAVMAAGELERQQTEAALKESEERFRAIIEQAAVGVAQIASKTGAFIQVNQKYCDIVGYSRSEMIEKTFQLITHPDDLAANLDNMKLLLEGQVRSFSMKKRYYRKDGSIVWVNLTVSPMWELGEETDYHIAVVEDITEHIRAGEEKARLEVQLRQAQKMEAIGTLAGGIAHDFNNILGTIFGYTQLALDDAKSGLANPEFLEQIFKSAKRARDLVQQILVLSRQSRHEKKPVDISLIIEEGIRFLRASLPSNIIIRQEISAGEAVILGDSTQIHQVLINLGTNAAHAMAEKGGSLDIGLTDLHLDADSAIRYVDLKPGPYLKLTVQDSGHGIAPSVIDRIFDPFFTTKDIGKGTGMGLSIVHGIVKQHGGAVNVFSEPGKGSIFSVLLPRFIGKKAAETTEVTAAIPCGSERVLLVDDEPGLIATHGKILVRLGYRVTSSTSSLEALEMFKASPQDYDLVITDMTMPYMTGDNLAREIMSLRPEIPVILCTGYSEAVSEEKIYETGIKGFLIKPIEVIRLAKLIRQVLAN
ncbi:MAG: PAS domain S-box protein [Deltaproteobacteria bacterium]|nr:PAS domain S-box protein [Deltaproteobacteria bacterium]